jgi:hypothetical protein
MIILTPGGTYGRHAYDRQRTDLAWKRVYFLGFRCKSPRLSPFIRSIDNVQGHWQMLADLQR